MIKLKVETEVKAKGLPKNPNLNLDLT